MWKNSFLKRLNTKGTKKAQRTQKTENEISKIVFESALKVHKTLGPGLLESAYEECLFYELKKFNLKVEKQKALPLVYEDVKLDVGYRIDIIVEDKFKSVETLNDVHLAQLLTYLRLSDCKLGLLINFNVKLLKEGVRRVVNGIL
ncbi:MAG: GxxExxY protein [Flavobacteriales bacterium 32-34-25]|nr:MAG: GxxExxY protein [Flavobacteriales bacterium 32-34-25]